LLLRYLKYRTVSIDNIDEGNKFNGSYYDNEENEDDIVPFN
jgi:hypothetical protein